MIQPPYSTDFSKSDEYEIDLWTTKDGELVAVSDAELDKASDGTGCVYDYTYGELLGDDLPVDERLYK